MYKLKRLVVGLDLSPLDETVIEYTALISKLLNVDKIYFIHVGKNLELPKEVLQKYPDLLAPVDEGIEFKIEEKVKNKFDTGFYNNNIEIKISEGNPFEKLLKWIKIKEADLVIMGLKMARSKEEGLLPRKITNLAPSSVLLVPENAKATITNIAVATDFSKYSYLALQAALTLQNVLKKAVEVFCQHIYEVPTGYHTTGKSYEEFANIMKKNSEELYDRFLKKFGLQDKKIKCHFELDKVDNTAKAIQKASIKNNANLIVVGSKGRTEAAAMLLGSIAEKLINYDHEIPLLIVKEKGENMTFIEALLNV